MSENLLSTQMNRELNNIHTNQEALRIMQNEYDRLIRQMPSGRKQANDISRDLLDPKEMAPELFPSAVINKKN